MTKPVVLLAHRRAGVSTFVLCLLIVASGCGQGLGSGGRPPGERGSAETDGPEPGDEAAGDGLATSSPSPRGGAPAVWMPSARRMILFGGMSPITGDTFEFDPDQNTWRPLSPETHGAVPAARCHHTFVALPGSDAGLLFGGFSFGGRFNDLWRFDAVDQRWTRLRPSGPPPARRCLHAAAFIESTGQMLVFGGIQGGGTRAADFFEDTHLLDVAANQWIRVETSGPGKLEGALAFYASADDAVYLWGGKQVDTYPTALWRFDVDRQTWATVETGGETPLGREDPTYFWDDDSQVLTIFSGWNETADPVLLDDGYELDLASRQWRRLEADRTPAARWRATVVFDPQARRGLMFGGWRDFGGSDSLDDTWSYDPAAAAWQRIASSGG
ncbi:MAG: Kelch repeat-containing protein [Planctomycetota bacterium]